ncbi:DUF805 domain-containing protein [Paraburkholderia graminis]|uniref:DUF805 domain-containing protein n=2 Tax=Burkholderiaceae TaxID=119060 RepID=UPI0024471FE4|nr:DUF805 domain-containing protein [Paraburkholderia graminis]MDQ0621725.1 uncharacterized membrane protein YhaH (DUF805 family) [Paraburkholderia graminis]
MEVWSELHSRRNQRCTRFHGLNGIYRVASVTARGFFGRFYQKEKNMKWYLLVLSKYVEFSGRARRKEYWMFLLFNVIIGIAYGVVLVILDLEESRFWRNLYPLLVFLPGLAALVRRMHDSNRSGWWALCPVANLVFACFEGTRGQNRFGPDPKQPTQ